MITTLKNWWVSRKAQHATTVKQHDELKYRSWRAGDPLTVSAKEFRRKGFFPDEKTPIDSIRYGIFLQPKAEAEASVFMGAEWLRAQEFVDAAKKVVRYEEPKQ